MLTGTPLDLTPFGSVLTAVGVVYWLLAIGALAFALKRPKTARGKVIATLVVLAVFGASPAIDIWNGYQARNRWNESFALFQERCKTAGEKIHRTVENVEGVVWMKWRSVETNHGDQFKLDDPYGRDCGGKDCIANLLRVTAGAEKNPEEAARHRSGYSFVETIDPADGKRYRYVGVIELPWSKEGIERHKKETGQDPPVFSHKFSVQSKPIEAYTARYGVTWDDISTREDREHWIAGGSLKVIDLQTNETLGERIGYLIDQGLGDKGGFRSPWPWARSNGPHCPAPELGYGLKFATKIAAPINQEK